MKTTIQLGLICVLLLSVCTSAHARLLRTVALSNQSTSEDGTTFSWFRDPVLNNLGQVAFQSALSGPEVSNANDFSVWIEASRTHLSLLAREGKQAPGLPLNVSFDILSKTILNDGGQVAFVAHVKGPGINSTNDGVVWRGTANSLSPIARERTSAPDGLSYNTLEAPRLNANGTIVFLESASGLDVTRGIWRHDEVHGTTSIARTGDQAPGLPTGATFSSFSIPSMNDSAHTAFTARINSLSLNGVWSQNSNGDLQLIAQAGSRAPNTPSGVNFGSFLDPIINSSGQIAFSATLNGTGITSSNDSGIWMQDPTGDLSLVAREGHQIPGATEGMLFSSLQSVRPAFNDSGKLAFHAQLVGYPGSSQGIWTRELEGKISLLARMGFHAPGTPDGVLFYGLGTPVMNAAGQVAFTAYLAGDGVDDSNNLGIWAQDTDGVLKLIARTGDELNITNRLGADIRVIDTIDTILGFNSLDPSGNSDGRSSAFNDSGQIVFATTFTDGSAGVFVSNAVAVPEPSNCILAMTLVLWACQRHKSL